jgi:hypothetical protein
LQFGEFSSRSIFGLFQRNWAKPEAAALEQSFRSAPMNEPALAGGVRVVLGSFSAATVIA